jgi:hypothetical protein
MPLGSADDASATPLDGLRRSIGGWAGVSAKNEPSSRRSGRRGRSAESPSPPADDRASWSTTPNALNRASICGHPTAAGHGSQAPERSTTLTYRRTMRFAQWVRSSLKKEDQSAAIPSRCRCSALLEACRGQRPKEARPPTDVRQTVRLLAAHRPTHERPEGRAGVERTSTYQSLRSGPLT